MSEKKFNNITDVLCNLATGDTFGITKLLLRCPMMQAVLNKQGLVKFDELPPEQVAVLIQHTPLEDWLDSNEVKKLLKISERTLQTLRSNGTLAYSKLNGKLYYRRQDLQELLSHNYKFSRNNKEI